MPTVPSSSTTPSLTAILLLREPFAVLMTENEVFRLTNGFFNNQTYYSASNLLKVVFDSPANGFFKNFWVAAYGEQAQGPNNCGGNYTKTGRVR